MAASAWTVFNNFRRVMANGVIAFETTNFDMHLFTTAASANINNDALTTLGSMSDEVVNGNGYLISGRLMAETWSDGDSVGQQRLSMAPIIWTATGGTILAIRYALIVARNEDSGKNTANLVLMRAPLTTVQFTLQQGSTLTISVPATDGIFELSGG